MNPFCEFIADGYKVIFIKKTKKKINKFKKYKCNMCGSLESVPNHYYSALDQEGKRLDFLQKTELS